MSFTITLNAADRGEAMLFYDFFFFRRVCSRRESVQSSGGCAVMRRVCSEVWVCAECSESVQ